MTSCDEFNIKFKKFSKYLLFCNFVFKVQQLKGKLIAESNPQHFFDKNISTLTKSLFNVDTNRYTSFDDARVSTHDAN